jgi:hypothetical protein
MNPKTTFCNKTAKKEKKGKENVLILFVVCYTEETE